MQRDNYFNAHTHQTSKGFVAFSKQKIVYVGTAGCSFQKRRPFGYAWLAESGRITKLTLAEIFNAKIGLLNQAMCAYIMTPAAYRIVDYVCDRIHFHRLFEKIL